MPKKRKSRGKSGELLQLRDAAAQLGVSFPTIKQWIYKKKIRSLKTAGGHHRIPQSELDKLLFGTGGGTSRNASRNFPGVGDRTKWLGGMIWFAIGGWRGGGRI